MNDFFIEYKQQILNIAQFLLRPVIVFFMGLSVVYLFGRMLGLVKKNSIRNLVCFTSMLGFHCLYSYLFKEHLNYFLVAWDILTNLAFSIILYVLIGFKLYDRVDSLFDKVAKDKKPKKHEKGRK